MTCCVDADVLPCYDLPCYDVLCCARVLHIAASFTDEEAPSKPHCKFLQLCLEELFPIIVLVLLRLTCSLVLA